MKAYVKRTITEHKELSEKVMKLKSFLNGENGVNIFTNIENNKTQEDINSNMVQFANMCMRLHSMEQYLGLLDVILHTEGIYFQNGQYVHITLQPVEDNTSVDTTNVEVINENEVEQN